MTNNFICKACGDIYDESEIEMKNYESTKVPICNNCNLSDIDDTVEKLISEIIGKDYNIEFTNYKSNISKYKKELQEELKKNINKEKYEKIRKDLQSPEPNKKILEKDFFKELSLTSGTSKPVVKFDSKSDQLFKDILEFLEDNDEYYCKKTLDYGIIVFKKD